MFAESTFLNLLRMRRLTDLRVAAPTPALNRLLDITGADQALALHATVANASA
ncbi:hypothetical protein [Streptomyces sp. NBC_00306]|uniref:hypothetical protein n=1 Tax=Streptomyces sp. NBC_00306 TaxID=2975708 RepID=UPI002E2A5355|nr:hypothetical protein [Streptomyces sp. NBC_00306]